MTPASLSPESPSSISSSQHRLVAVEAAASMRRIPAGFMELMAQAAEGKGTRRLPPAQQRQAGSGRPEMPRPGF